MAESEQIAILRPIVDAWRERIGYAHKSKEGFRAIGKQCEQFYSADMGFMWERDFMTKNFGGDIAPQFKITIAKAFELVAIVGPVLYWKYPNRAVKSYDPIELTPEVFGDPEDPMVQQMFQQAMVESEKEKKIGKTRNSLMQTYLNYSQREQPGTLSMHAENAITEALIKGRGCLWVEPYTFPGSKTTLTGCFYDTVDNLLIDPDCTMPDLSDAMWIARRHVDPSWKVERRFKMRRGELYGKGAYETEESKAVQTDASDYMDRMTGRTNDLIVWYEVWSKGGAGVRRPFDQQATGLGRAFDSTVGDYAYICVTNNYDYPLNAPRTWFEQASTADVKKALRWPNPYYKDGRWPVALLDFYRKPRSPWPLAPMAMGLGELMFMNVIVSMLANRVHTHSQDFVAYLASHAKQVESKLKSGENRVFIEINDVAQKSISDIIQFIKAPEINFDVFKVLDMVSNMFDKRVGLTELLYGLNPGGAASRTAADINAKQEMTSVRPEYMAGKVEDWMSESANLEKFCARWNVTGKDIKPLVGGVGSLLWDKHIAGEDPEIIVREMKATVEAGSVRKPNKARDNTNLQQISQYLLPEISKHADVTGDTRPINAFFDSLGKAMDQSTEGWQMGPREPQQPESSPEEIQAQQQAEQMEMAKLEAEVTGKQLDAQSKQIDLQTKQVELQGKTNETQNSMQTKQIEFEFDLKKKRSELEHDDEKNEQTLDHQDEMGDLDIDQKRAEARLKLRSAAELANIKIQSARATAAQSPPKPSGAQK